MAFSEINHEVSVAQLGASVSNLEGDAEDLRVAQLGASASNLEGDASDLRVAAFGINVAMRADNADSLGATFPASITNYKEDTDVIYSDIIFPECITYGSTGLPRYFTEKIEVESGSEQRNARRAFPRYEYSVVMTNLPAEEYKEVMEIWHVCSGDQAGFLFLDFADHTSNTAGTSIGGTEVGFEDQLVALAVAGQSDYELYKYYTKESRSKQRRIRYPKDGTLRVGIDGVEVFNWEYSYNDHLLKFTTPFGIMNGATLSVTGGVVTGADFSLLVPGDLVYISGWSNANRNRTIGGNPLRVVAADAAQVSLEEYTGGAYTGTDLAGEVIDVEQTVAPVGAQITAGFYFYVPVRFAEGDVADSEIVSGARETQFANFDRLALREIFD